MNKTLHEIVEEVKGNGKPDYEDLKYALLVYSVLFNSTHRAYMNELLVDSKATREIKEMRADNSFKLFKKALSTPPKEFLGPQYDPENPEYKKFHKAGVKLIDKIFGKQDEENNII